MITGTFFDQALLARATPEDEGGGLPVTADLQGHWTADALTGLSDDDPVSTWADQSGNGNDFTQGTGTSQPLYKVNILNSLPAVRFDNTDDGMISNMNVTGAFSIFFVYSSQATSGFHRALQGETANWLFGPYSGKHQIYRGDSFGLFMVGPNVSAGTPVLVTIIRDGTGSIDFRVDQTDIVNAFAEAPGELVLGGAGGAFVEPMNGDVFELVVYDAALSDTDRDDVEDYLATKWGL